MKHYITIYLGVNILERVIFRYCIDLHILHLFAYSLHKKQIKISCTQSNTLC